MVKILIFTMTEIMFHILVIQIGPISQVNDIYNKTDDVFWRQEVVEHYAQMLGFERTPIVATGTLDEIAELVKSAPASKVNPEIEMEGIVIRPVKELKNSKNERIIYKVKVADLLGRNAKRI